MRRDLAAHNDVRFWSSALPRTTFDYEHTLIFAIRSPGELYAHSPLSKMGRPSPFVFPNPICGSG